MKLVVLVTVEDVEVARAVLPVEVNEVLRDSLVLVGVADLPAGDGETGGVQGSFGHGRGQSYPTYPPGDDPNLAVEQGLGSCKVSGVFRCFTSQVDP